MYSSNGGGFLTSCSDSGDDGPSTVAVTGVTLDKTTVGVTAGEKVTLTATVAPNNATNKNLTWSSGDESVATVSDAGVVTGVKAGTATITVTANGAAEGTLVKAECTVTVTAATKPVTSLTVKKGEAEATTLTIKDTDEPVTLTETHEPSDTTDTITWTSSNPDVATVENGLVTPLKVGETTITVKANDTISKTVAVTVAKTPVTSVTISGKTAVATSSEISDLAATVLPANATNKTVTWSVEIPETDGATGTTIDESTGKLTTGATAGTVNVFATADGVKSAAYVVTVKAPVDVTWDWTAETKPIVAETQGATTTATTLEEKTGYAISNDSNNIAMVVDASSGKLSIRSSNKDVQLDKGTVLKIPVSVGSVLYVKAKTADYKVNGVQALKVEETYSATTVAGYIELTAIATNYIETIKVSGIKASDSFETEATLTAVAVTSLTLSQTKTLSKEVGDTISLAATVAPTNRTDKVVWSVDGDSVTIKKQNDLSATFTAVTAGTATIKATCGEISKELSVVVAEKAPNAFTVSYFGDEIQDLKATISLEGAVTAGLPSVSVTSPLTYTSELAVDTKTKCAALTATASENANAGTGADLVTVSFEITAGTKAVSLTGIDASLYESASKHIKFELRNGKTVLVTQDVDSSKYATFDHSTAGAGKFATPISVSANKSVTLTVVMASKTGNTLKRDVTERLYSVVFQGTVVTE